MSFKVKIVSVGQFCVAIDEQNQKKHVMFLAKYYSSDGSGDSW